MLRGYSPSAFMLIRSQAFEIGPLLLLGIDEREQT
jgi:hypothetical protein